MLAVGMQSSSASYLHSVDRRRRSPVDATTCTIHGITWRDTSDPRNDPYIFGSLPPRDVVVAARQDGLTQYELHLSVRGADLPGPLSRTSQLAMMQRLVAVKQQAEDEYQT